jgi:hypothetical protein
MKEGLFGSSLIGKTMGSHISSFERIIRRMSSWLLAIRVAEQIRVFVHRYQTIILKLFLEDSKLAP